MKIRVTTDKHEYQGLYKDSEHAVKDSIINPDTGVLVFIENMGKEWVLPKEEYDVIEEAEKKEEYTGKSVDYYKVKVDNPTTEGNTPYLAECNDLIEALGMNYAEGNAFKAIWRKCAARKFGVKKKGYDNGLYDSEKVVFFGGRMVEQSKGENK